MGNIEKSIIFVALIFLFFALITLEYNQETGRREDPFRCSDAKEYFHQVGVEVDCQRINEEVNE